MMMKFLRCIYICGHLNRKTSAKNNKQSTIGCLSLLGVRARCNVLSRSPTHPVKSAQWGSAMWGMDIKARQNRACWWWAFVWMGLVPVVVLFMGEVKTSIAISSDLPREPPARAIAASIPETDTRSRVATSGWARNFIHSPLFSLFKYKFNECIALE